MKQRTSAKTARARTHADLRSQGRSPVAPQSGRSIRSGSVLDRLTEEETPNTATVLASMSPAEVRREAPGLFRAAIEHDQPAMAEAAARALLDTWRASSEVPAVPFDLHPSLWRADAYYALAELARAAFDRSYSRPAATLLLVASLQLDRAKRALVAKRSAMPSQVASPVDVMQSSNEAALSEAILGLQDLAISHGVSSTELPSLDGLSSTPPATERNVRARRRRAAQGLEPEVFPASERPVAPVADPTPRAAVRLHADTHPLEGSTVFYANEGPNRYGRIRSPAWIEGGTTHEVTSRWGGTTQGPWVLVEDTRAVDAETGRPQIRYLGLKVDRDIRVGTPVDGDDVEGLGDVQYRAREPDEFVEFAAVDRHRYRFLLFIRSDGQRYGRLGDEAALGRTMVSERGAESPDSGFDVVTDSFVAAVDTKFATGSTRDAFDALSVVNSGGFGALSLETRIRYAVAALKPAFFDASEDAKATVVGEIFGSLDDAELREMLAALNTAGVLERLATPGTLARVSSQLGWPRRAPDQTLRSEDVRAFIIRVADEAGSSTGLWSALGTATGLPVAIFDEDIGEEIGEAALDVARDVSSGLVQASSFGDYVSGRAFDEMVATIESAGLLAQKLFYVRFMLHARALGFDEAHQRGQEVLDAVDKALATSVVGMLALERAWPGDTEFINIAVRKAKAWVVVEVIQLLVGAGEVKSFFRALKLGELAEFFLRRKRRRRRGGGFKAATKPDGPPDDVLPDSAPRPRTPADDRPSARSPERPKDPKGSTPTRPMPDRGKTDADPSGAKKRRKKPDPDEDGPIAADAAKAVPDASGVVSDRVPGLYEAMGNDLVRPHGWKTKRKTMSESDLAKYGFQSSVKGGGSGQDIVVRVVDHQGAELTVRALWRRKEGEFVLFEAFKDPRMVSRIPPEVTSGVGLTSDGTPPFHFAVMRAMHAAKIGPGEIRKIRYDTVENLETLAQLRSLQKARPDAGDSELLAELPLFRPDRPDLLQSGHRVIGKPKMLLNESGSVETFGRLIDYYVGLVDLSAKKMERRRLEAILEKFGLDPEDVVPLGFHVEQNLNPLTE